MAEPQIVETAYYVAVAGNPVRDYPTIEAAAAAAAGIPDGHVITVNALDNGQAVDAATGAVLGTWEA